LSTRSQSVIRGGVIRYLLASYCRQGSVLGPLLRAIPLNASTKQVLGLRRSEQRAYLEGLHRFNQEQPLTRSGTRGAAAALYKIRKAAGLIRRYNQLPCTVETRQRRADLLTGLDPEQQRILVLGDDDLVSVELARRGFRHVTVADCDAQLIATIARETAGLATPPHIVHADFRRGFVCPEPMDVVFLDPPYSIDGALAFLRLAFASAKDAPTTRVYLMINPAILGSAFAAITDFAARFGYRLAERRPGFNAYPLGAFEATVLRAAWQLVLHLPLPANARGGLLFCSDCFVFERDVRRP
jgi:hypothetical protein